MLIGIAINPDCFGPDVVIDEESRRGAEKVLSALLSNGVLLQCHGEHLLPDILSAAEKLSTSLGQQIRIASEDVYKERKRSLSTKAQTLAPGTSPIERLRRVAIDTAPDVVICATADQVYELRDLDSIEVCTLADFPDSDAEARRIKWNEKQRLDHLDSDDCNRLIGRAIRYGDEVVIADYVFGRVTDVGNRTQIGTLQRFANGVVYIAELWCEHAPMSGGNLARVKIVTKGGIVGAAGSVKGDAANVIEAAVRAADIGNSVGSLKIELKQDAIPPIFRQRLLSSGHRTWCVDHGFDDIGKLALPLGKRSFTTIDHDCRVNRELLGDILKLPDVK